MLLTFFIVSSTLVSVTTIIPWLQQQVLSNLARSEPPTACNTDGDAVQFALRMLSRFVSVYKHFLVFFRMQYSSIQFGAKKSAARKSVFASRICRWRLSKSLWWCSFLLVVVLLQAGVELYPDAWRYSPSRLYLTAILLSQVESISSICNAGI